MIWNWKRNDCQFEREVTRGSSEKVLFEKENLMKKGSTAMMLSKTWPRRTDRKRWADSRVS
jgi:hypothetical protein